MTSTAAPATTSLDDVGTWLRDRLPALVAQHEVPGAAVAVLVGNQVVDAAAGLLSTATEVEATPDSVFQIGSITKVWTASLVLQLVDDGLVELDGPVRRYLPEFRLGDEEAAAAITVRQLLSHTAGFEGDVFTDTGRGDDCVEKFVATLGDLDQLFPPGQQFSYNNAGYSVLGRLVEVLRGKAYDDCLRDHLIAPLGLGTASPGPYEAILHRVAVGHLRPEPGAEQVPAPVWSLVRSNGPAGSTLAMSARDLLGFARMHLDGGTAPDGTVVLARGTVAAMQEEQVRLPALRVLGDAWGLGWELYDADTFGGTRVVGHDGNTIGQASFLRVLPEQGIAVALLTNGGNPYGLFHDVVGHVLQELVGTPLPALPAPPAEPVPVDVARVLGTYANLSAEIVVEQDDDGRIWRRLRPLSEVAELSESPARDELVGLDVDSLVPVVGEMGLHVPHVFLGDDGHGRARYLHVGRAIPRVAD